MGIEAAFEGFVARDAFSQVITKRTVQLQRGPKSNVAAVCAVESTGTVLSNIWKREREKRGCAVVRSRREKAPKSGAQPATNSASDYVLVDKRSRLEIQSRDTMCIEMCLPAELTTEYQEVAIDQIHDNFHAEEAAFGVVA